MNDRQRTLLIDGDILLYKFACGNAMNFDWGDGITSSLLDFKAAQEEAEEFILSLMRATDTDENEPIICFSCPKEENFRYKVLPTYKHNRQDKEKPQMYYDLKHWLKDNYFCKEKPTLEADDVLGILATKQPNEYVIASIDKDLKQIPGTHYNWKNKDYFEVSQEEADYFFYMQVLMGDPTDGYGGCPGVGKKKAEKILKEPLYYAEEDAYVFGYDSYKSRLWKAIVDTYESKGLSEEDALTQARVARILRAEDYDFKKGEVKLWKPC